MKISLTSITVLPDRQRRGYGPCDDLIESIPRLGLIQPIVLTRSNVLVAGGRRLFAMRKLAFAELEHGVHFIYTDEVDPVRLKEIELEENIKRKALYWQDEFKAIAELHNLRRAANESWTQADTAKSIGLDESTISRVLMVVTYAQKDGTIYEAQKASVAVNTVQRAREREQQTRFENLLEDEDEVVESETRPITSNDPQHPDTVASLVPRDDRSRASRPVEREYPFYHADAFDYFAKYSGPRFNFIHCDFPYGIDFQKMPRQNSSNQERYEDSPDIFFDLVERLLPRLPIADAAHMIFWFSPKHYEYILEQLRKQEWKLDPYPLIWFRSDSKGIIPDTNRSGRYVYEMAFHCTRGDRKIVRPVNNLYACPRGEVQHPSQKPQEMLEHFFRMFIDSSSHVLDPTCGSATALKVAKRLGAARVLGTEQDEKAYATACALWDDKQGEFEL